MLVVRVCFALFFFLSAYLNLNDPDPEWWLVCYGSSGVLCLMSAFCDVPVILYYIVAASVSLWMPFIIMEESFVTPDPAVQARNLLDYEQVREVGGLSIVLIAMIYLNSTVSSKGRNKISYILLFVLLPVLVAAIFSPKIFSDFSHDSHCNGMFMEA